MPRFAFRLAYNGRRFQGWQSQPGGQTIQDKVEKAFSVICREHIRIHASGRTDAGVHALGQIIHCDLPENKKNVNWMRALNSLLPEDICMTGKWRVADDFHARKWAISKKYSYTFWTEPRFVLPQRRPFVWPAGELNAQEICMACSYLQGSLDFASFMNSGTPVSSTVRTVFRTEIKSACARELTLHISANGFLKQMVRNIAGLLYAVGKEKISPGHIPAILAARDRSKAPATAPPQGLCLLEVSYPSCN